MAKELTEQEFQDDALLNSYARVQEFYLNNKNVIIGSGIAVILAIVLAIGYHYYQKTQNDKAQELMGMAEDSYLRGDYETALNGSDENFTVGFKQIIKNYSGTQAGNLAHYYASVCEFNLGNSKQALDYINSFDVPDGILGVAPLSFKGVLLTDTGNPQKAAEAYVNAAEWDKNDSTTPFNYLEAANAYHEAGKNAKAKKYARMVVNNYSDSPQISDAQKLLGELGAVN